MPPRHRQHRRPFSPSTSPKRRRGSGVLCGINAVYEALQAEARQLATIWIAEGKEGPRIAELLALARARDIEVQVKPASRLTTIVGTPTHQGVLAFLTPAIGPTFEDLLGDLSARTPVPPITVLDGVKDPRNLGAIIRCAATFGVGGVVLRSWRAVGLTATVAKTAAGGLEHVVITQVANLPHSLKRLKERGFWVIGADEHGDAACDTFVFPSPLALVLGEEGRGITPLVRRHCDVMVRIPSNGPFRSLNVAVAAGVLFYTVACQRRR